MAFTPDPVSNFGYGTVSVPPSPATSGLTLTLQTGEGALFPNAAVEGDFNVTAYPPDTGPLLSNAEIIRVSANSGDVLTFARGQEGTVAKAIAAGWQVAFAPTAKTMQDIFDAINAITPGSGDVVGPASAVDSRPALFDGVTGKLLKQASAALGSAAFVATSTFDAAGAAAAAQSAAASDATTKANAAQAAAIAASAAKTQSFLRGIGFDGGGDPIAPSSSGYAMLERAITLTSIRLTLPYGDTASITVAIQKNGSTVSASDPVVLTSGNTVLFTSFTGWTTLAFAAGDRLGAVVVGTPTAEYCELNFNGTGSLA